MEHLYRYMQTCIFRIETADGCHIVLYSSAYFSILVYIWDTILTIYEHKTYQIDYILTKVFENRKNENQCIFLTCWYQGYHRYAIRSKSIMECTAIHAKQHAQDASMIGNLFQEGKDKLETEIVRMYKI